MASIARPLSIPRPIGERDRQGSCNRGHATLLLRGNARECGSGAQESSELSAKNYTFSLRAVHRRVKDSLSTGVTRRHTAGSVGMVSDTPKKEQTKGMC